MGDPDMHSEESIVIRTPNVFVKSIPFEAILTNKRIILVDRKKDLIPSKDILLATIRNIEPGENAIRDQIISLSIITSTGETRQVVLTFSREAGGNRKRERDEWVKSLRQLTTSPVQQALRKVIPVIDQEPLPKSQEPLVPKLEITSRPSAKKEIDAVQQIKKIVEMSNAPPKPVETISLPQGMFCSKCGNRVPAESIFCNRCGTKIVVPGPEGAAESAAEKSPKTSLIPPAQPEVPAADLKVPPHLSTVTASQLEQRERPIEEAIRSIEPLIAGSVPRSEPARVVQPPPTTESATVDKPLIEQVTVPQIPTPSEISSGKTPPLPQPKKRSILPQLFLRKDLPKQPAPAGMPPASPFPQSSPAPGFPRRIAVIVMVILVVIGGAFLYMAFLSGAPSRQETPATVPPTVVPATSVPTPLPTTPPPVTTSSPPTPAPTPAVPSTGVWVKVKYSGGWAGSYGVPGGLQQVTGTGDQFYQIPAGDGIVQVSFQKLDGSGNALIVEVYKNGILIQSDRTTAPKGTVEFQVDLKPATPTVSPTAKQTTVNATATQTQTPPPTPKP
jgi:DNA-directed RNA polymerase subunit RPC12/RpoP